MNLYTLSYINPDGTETPVRDMIGPVLTSSYRAARAKGIAESRYRHLPVGITRIDGQTLRSRRMVEVKRGKVHRV